MGWELYGRSLCPPLSFAVDLKLLSKAKSIKKNVYDLRRLHITKLP